jgi:hypothetical protein
MGVTIPEAQMILHFDCNNTKKERAPIIPGKDYLSNSFTMRFTPESITLFTAKSRFRDGAGRKRRR